MHDTRNSNQAIVETELHAGSINYNHHLDRLRNNITKIIINCAKKSFSRGKANHHRVLWSKNLEELRRKREDLRNTPELTWKTEDVLAWRRQSAVLKQPILQAKRTTSIASSQIPTTKMIASTPSNS